MVCGWLARPRGLDFDCHHRCLDALAVPAGCRWQYAKDSHVVIPDPKAGTGPQVALSALARAMKREGKHAGALHLPTAAAHQPLGSCNAHVQGAARSPGRKVPAAAATVCARAAEAPVPSRIQQPPCARAHACC